MEINLTLLGQMITFVIFVYCTMQFIWPVLNSVLEERRQKIIDGLNAAEESHKVLARVKDQTKIEMRTAENRVAKKNSCYNLQSKK